MGAALKASYGIPDPTASHGGTIQLQDLPNQANGQIFLGRRSGPLVSVHDVGPQNNGGQFKNPARISCPS